MFDGCYSGRIIVFLLHNYGSTTWLLWVAFLLNVKVYHQLNGVDATDWLGFV